MLVCDATSMLVAFSSSISDGVVAAVVKVYVRQGYYSLAWSPELVCVCVSVLGSITIV